jgi:hypothetical protein
MKESGERPEKKSMGMRLSQVTTDRMYDIVDIYGRVVGGDKYRKFVMYDPAVIQDEINQLTKGRNAAEFRLGSNLPEDTTQDGKLVLWKAGREQDGETLVRFAFDPNVVEGEAADAKADNFQSAVTEYLLEENVAVELPKRD